MVDKTNFNLISLEQVQNIFLYLFKYRKVLCRRTDVLLRSRRNLTLDTINNMTVREGSTTKKLAEVMKRQGAAVCGVQKNRRVHAKTRRRGLTSQW